MERDTLRMRGQRPYVFTNLKTGQGLDRVLAFLIEEGGLGLRDPAPVPAIVTDEPKPSA